MIKSLVESMRIENSGNITALNIFRHLKRLKNSVIELKFQIPASIEPENFELFFFNQIKNFLQYKFKKIFESYEYLDINPIKKLDRDLYKLRLTYDKDGKFKIEIENYQRNLNQPLKIKILEEFIVEKNDTKWQHKFFPREDISIPVNFDEVIWKNDKGEICEGSFSNIIWQKQGELFTPTQSCNLLPGIAREILLENNKINTGAYMAEELETAEKIFLCNAMMGLQAAEF